MSSDVISHLCSSKKLDRDAGLAELQRILPTLDKNTKLELQSSLLQTLNDSGATWESILGCLLGAKFAVQYANLECDKEAAFTRQLMKVSHQKLRDHTEARVHVAAGEVLGVLCTKVGPAVYEETRELVLNLVQHHLSQQFDPVLEQLSAVSQRRGSTDIGCSSAAEASLHTLQCIVEGCGGRFITLIDQELLELIATALDHKSRGVRESGFYLSASVASCTADADRGDAGETGVIFELGHALLNNFAKGLSDDWSPVRLAASVAVRRFLVALPSDEARKQFYPMLLPRMCLNRYYSAEGVRIYSQETWRQVAGCAGRELVQQNLENVVQYYSQSCLSLNHTVREAACACLAELATKVNLNKVRPYVPRLLRILLRCFTDDTWPVRDAACLACGSFVFSFPNESTPILPDLYPAFFHNLEDAVPTVRSGAASALASVIRVHQSALPLALKHINQGFDGLSKQPCDIPDKPTKQSVCGTMTPRLGRAGSMDHRLHRSSQPWEVAEGCVVLVSELSSLPNTIPSLLPILPLLAAACTKRHYEAHLNFLESVCKNLPTIAKGVGKKNFKIHVDCFLEPVFYALESENALASSAASQCLNQLSSFLGPNVMRARVQANSPSHLRHLDANLFIAPF